MTAERKLLGRSGCGDKISIGWRVREGKKKDREPIAECIERLGSILKATTAFETTGKLSYDYLEDTTTSCSAAELGGGFMRLVCMESGINAVELLQPIYDLCAWLSHPQIWYDRVEPTFPKGEYAIEEARAVFPTDKSDAFFGAHNREFAGAYYPSYDKVLGIIKRLTPLGTDENLDIKDMLKVDAYYAFKNTRRTEELANWLLAQDRMAARAILYMRDNPWTNTGWDRWLDISGPLEMPDGYHSIYELGRLDGVDRFHLLVSVLGMLKADDRLHVVRAEIPVELYLNGVMTWSKHRPGDD